MYLRLKIRIIFGEFLTFKYEFINLAETNFMTMNIRIVI